MVRIIVYLKNIGQECYLSRVPCVGELIEIEHNEYHVSEVTHLKCRPNVRDCIVARVTVTKIGTRKNVTKEV